MVLLASSITFSKITGPQLTGGAEFRYLLPEIPKDIDVKRKPPDKIVYIVSPPQDFIDISVGNLDGIGDFLNRCRSRLADVVAADADWIRPRHFLHGVFNGVPNETDSGFNRKYPSSTADHLFKNVILGSRADFCPLKTVLLGNCLIHG